MEWRKSSSILSLLVVILLGISEIESTDIIDANRESYQVQLERTVQRCYTSTICTCTDFKDYNGWRCYRACCYLLVYSYWYIYERKCTEKKVTNCCPYKETYTETRYRCKAGWDNFPYCNVAICNPACTTGQQCITPNRCVCEAGSTGTCITTPCSETNNCYPGTCTSGTCKCPPGFAGPNCIEINLTPQISTCSAKLYSNPDGTERIVGDVTECAAVGLEPQIIWVGLSARKSPQEIALTKLDVTWVAQYANPIVMPNSQSARHIANSPVSIGVSKSDYTIELIGSGANIPPVNCPQAYFRTGESVPNVALCRNIVKLWSDLGISGQTQHNASLLITINAELGGEKIGARTVAGGGFGAQRFNASSSISRKMLIKFDFERPTHCAKSGVNDQSSCNVFPIFINETITRDSRIQPTFNSWTDSGSGIQRFRAETFYLQSNADGYLEKIGDPLCVSENIDYERNNYVCDLRQPGTYAVHVTAYDWANNTAFARKIVTYIDKPSVEQTDAPIQVVEADPRSDYRFITDLPEPADGKDYQFTVDWSNTFRSTLQGNLLLAVKPLQAADDVIDDVYGTTFGVRSTAKLLPNAGIPAFEFEYTVRPDGGLGVQPTYNTTVYNDTSITRQPFKVSKIDLSGEGSTIIMWVTARDIEGKTYTKEGRVTVHRSPSDIKVPKAEFLTETPSKFYSSVQLDIISRIGGIKNITFDIFDRTKQLFIRTGQVVSIKYRNWPYEPVTREKRQTPAFPNPCNVGDNSCYCIPTKPCYNVSQYLEIDNCWIDRFSGDEIAITYTINTLSGYTISNADNPVVKLIDSNKVKCRPSPGLPGWAIFLIVLGCLLFLLLLLLLLLMLWRWRHQKHPVPTRMRTMFNDIRKRASNTHTTENELYAATEAKPRVFYKDNLQSAKVQASPNSSDRDGNFYESLIVYNSKNLHVGTQTLGEGRFATIKKGTLQDGNINVTVAIKALKHGYSRPDAEIMQKKILEMSKIPHHPNIVNLKGIYKDEVSGREPCMVLDYCETPLTDWLESLKVIEPETLDTMHNYAKDIGRGMEHLHDNNIIHRRLTAKNVLLSPTPHGTIAKVSGFGPSKDDHSEDGKANNALVKVKWLAPETIATLKSSHPDYDEKSDAWSYGVTMWEMYSKGEPPYSDIKSSDLLKQLKKGHRLPRPEYCAPELYNDVIQPCWNADPKQRPSFETICRLLDRFRSGANLQEYYAADDVAYRKSIPEGYYAPDKFDKEYSEGRGGGNEYRDSNFYADGR